MREPGDGRRIPADAVLLPLGEGRLLVSPGHAVFCRIAAADVAGVEQVLAAGGELAAALEGGAVPTELLAALDRHGFFGPPRPPEDDPPTVGLQLTNACDSACTYCCTNSGDARVAEVTFERMCAVVDQIEDALGSRARVALLGGEPLLVPWATELAARVLDRGLALTLFSNGMVLARAPTLAARVAALARRGMEVRISLPGPNADRCDGAAGVPRFDLALEGLHALHRAGGSAIVDLMLLPEDVDALVADLPALRRRLPPDTTLTFGVIYRGGRETGDHIFDSAAALEAALDRVAFEAGEAIPAPEPSPLAFRREGCDCVLGQSINVRSDGALFGCFKMEERLGHLDRLSIGEAVRQLREAPQRATSLPRCADCPLATLCGGGCRSENLLLTGVADEPVCDTWRVRVLCELLAEDRVAALHWPTEHLLAEAHRRGISAPAALTPQRPSTHLADPALEKSS